MAVRPKDAYIALGFEMPPTDLTRRRFVQLLSAAATAVAVGPSSALTLEQNQYTNRRLGFSFRKPSTWHYLSYQEFSISGAEVASNYDDLESLRESQGTPLVVIAKHYQTPPEFSPSIVVYGGVPDELLTVERLLDLDLSDFARKLPDFKIEEGPLLDQVSGVSASRVSYTYRVESNQGHVGQFRTTAYAFVHHEAVLTFNLTGIVGGTESSQNELAACSRSITFSRRLQHEAHSDL